MTGFAALQDAFQRAILDGDRTVLAELTDGARETRGALFEVYAHAYLSRLVEALSKEHEMLHTYLGDDMFGEMASAYLAAHPSRHPSIRWISRHLPAFLGEAEPFRDQPAIADLAAFEKALNDAFDAPDGDVLAGDALAAIPPEDWQDLVVVPHPAAQRLDLTTNATAIWAALRADEPPPDAEVLERPAAILIWRHESTPMYRELSPEEAMLWDEARAAVPFGQLCVMLATMDDPASAPQRAVAYLAGWIAAGLLAEAKVV